MHKHIDLHHYLHVTEITEMYLSIAFRSFAIAIIGVFIPVILLTNGYTFLEVLQYYLMFAVMAFFMFIVAIELMRTMGIKHVMALNVLFLLGFFALLITLPTQHWPTFFPAMLHATSSAFFWSSFHIEFTQLSSKRKAGQQVGLFNAISQGLSLIAPLIGAIFLLLFFAPLTI